MRGSPAGAAPPHDLPQESQMTDAQIQAKATIAAALIQSRSIDAEALGSLNKDISNHKLAHLRELTERIYAAVSRDSSD
jgi:hypothetical protein